jgi:hypothetical protein
MSHDSSEPLTYEEAADTLWAMIPHDISNRELVPYGIDVSERAAEAFTRELLSLNLFWISLALHVPISRHAIDRDEAQRVFACVTKNARDFRVGRFGYSRDELQVYSDEAEKRDTEYHIILGDKGNPAATLAHFVLNLLATKAIELEDSDKALANGGSTGWSGSQDEREDLHPQLPPGGLAHAHAIPGAGRLHCAAKGVRNGARDHHRGGQGGQPARSRCRGVFDGLQSDGRRATDRGAGRETRPVSGGPA